MSSTSLFVDDTVANLPLPALRIEGATAAGVFEQGLETIKAGSMRDTGRRVAYTHPTTGAQSLLLTIDGFSEGAREWLKSVGLLFEIISSNPRMFAPMTSEGAAIVGRLLARQRLIEVAGQT
jgi:hypothetical protein